ncbi:MAG: DUF4426 domain-containing protein [Gammaproteobacteria bacterium]|nr:DUF4426 domain-containing protein [Gammaproteobacteria bacterium]
MRGSFSLRAKLNLFAKSLFILALLGLGTNATAENSRVFGDYVVHYNAFRSDTLSPEIAKAYELTRRNNRIIVNITVLKKVMGTTGKPVAATIAGNASNLTGQMKNLEFREIKEGTAIYYIAELKVSDGEFLKFKLNITPEGEQGPARLQFSKRFFTY